MILESVFQSPYDKGLLDNPRVLLILPTDKDDLLSEDSEE
jgi:hypothetical protein